MITAFLAPKALLSIVGVGAIALAIGYGSGYLKGFTTAKDRSALLFERALIKAQQEADHRVQEALDAAEANEPTPADDAGLVSLCNRAGSACRDRKG